MLTFSLLRHWNRLSWNSTWCKGPTAGCCQRGMCFVLDSPPLTHSLSIAIQSHDQCLCFDPPNPCPTTHARLLKSAWALQAPRPSGYASSSRRLKRFRAEVKQIPTLTTLVPALFHFGSRARIIQCCNLCVMLIVSVHACC